MALPRVEVSIGVTLNVGNYESVRADARYGADGITWKRATEEAEAGLAAALEGINRMLESRKQPEKKEHYPPMGRAPGSGVGRPSR